MMFTPTKLGNHSNSCCETMRTARHQRRVIHPLATWMAQENNKTRLTSYSTSHREPTTCCPLRLNELSPTSCNTRSMKLKRAIGDNNMTVTCESLEAQSVGGDSNKWIKKLVNSSYEPSAIQMNERRQRLSSSSSILCSSHMRLIQLVAIIIVTILVSPLDCQSADTQIAPTVASLCPLVSSCLCKWSGGKISTTCERRNLQTIPMQLPNDIQILDMTGNNLVELPQHIFQERRLTNLQRLFLSECRITHISDEAFAQLTNLIELDLSHNQIQQVPSKALELTKYSLRKLNLAHNLIHILNTGSFIGLNHLESLDLSNNQLGQMRSNSFQGLTDLKELKLNENKLTQLPANVISDFHEYLLIDLYGNPWHCDCELRQSIELMHRRHIQQSINPTCASPSRHKDIRWQNVKSDEFMCPPVIVNKQNELIVGAGSNVTLECTARGSPPLTFVWFQDEKNLIRSGANNNSEPPPSTKLLEEKRYEIAEEQGQFNTTTSILYLMNLRLTDTSLFLCWVENSAGYTLGNFSLTVNDSPPFSLAGGGSSSSVISSFGNSILRFFGFDSNDSTGTQISLALIALLLLLLIAIACLLVLKQFIGGHSSKSSSSSDLKAYKANGKLSSSNKFGPAAAAAGPAGKSGAMFASSDDVGTSEDDDDGQASSGSQSSCRKNNNPKIIAVNDLDGFIEHMRSGIINMDYHNLSPVVQFNDTMKRSNQQQRHHHQQEAQQLPLLNHFQTASNASSQQPLYGIGQTSNGTNSMATTLSDLSPSSGSASTSFANANQVMYTQHPQQHLMGTINEDMSTLSRRPPPTANCDFQGHPSHQLTNGHHHHQQQHQPLHQQEASSAPSYTSDCQSGYSEDPLLGPGHHHHSAQMIPPTYNYDMNMFAQHQQQLYNPMTLIGGGAPVQNQQGRNVMRKMQGSPSDFQIL